MRASEQGNVIGCGVHVHHRRRKIFLSMGELNENKICVGGEVVLFIITVFQHYNK